MSDNETTRLSKFLSFVLRHAPETIGITLDPNGGTDTADLLERVNGHGYKLTPAGLAHIVASSPKQRFAFNADQTRIRANQGHSVSVDLGYAPTEPPQTLYHGTGAKALSAILATGLDKRNRHHVHLSPDVQTALTVGTRHGRPVVLEVDAQRMHQDGFQFFVSNNGVWLTDYVPVSYLKPLTTPNAQ